MALRLPYLLVVKRDTFELEVWYRGPARTKYRLAEQYKIAVGREGYETPAGCYFVQAKARRPEWLIPDSPWAKENGLVPGTIIPGDAPNNPIKGAFLKLTDDGVGLHGTGDLTSLGSKASHGCIRLHPDVAISLHRRIPTGTPVVIL